MDVKHGRTLLAALCLLVFSATSFGADGKPEDGGKNWLAEIARAHGLEQWPEVKGLQFTFRVQLPGREVIRHWRWHPGEDRVELREAGHDPVHFFPAKVLSGEQPEAREAHAKFINDRYWLLFPLHLAWDEGLSLAEVVAEAEAPGGAKATRLRLEYGPQGGYTPGDVYRLYVDEKHHILGWDFLPAGDPSKMRTFTWLDPVLFQSLRLYRSHPAVSGQVAITFTGLAVQWQGSDEWKGPMDQDIQIEELKQADRDFAAAAHDRGLEGWLSFFTEDAVRMDLFGKVAQGHAGIREVDGPLFAAPDLQLRWQPETAGLFSGGTQGYTKGPYQLVRLSEDGEKVLSTGYYLSLWRLVDGRWKVYLDTGAPTPPASSPGQGS